MHTTLPSRSHSELGNRGLVIYAGLLTALGAFAVDSTLPMFVAMADELGTDVGALPQTITVFLFAIGVGQLLFGPVSDRYGRRPVLAIGLGLNLIGALVCYFSTSLDTMLVGRVIQGFGSGVGPAVGRAMLRDRFTGDELARQFAISVAVFSIGPIVGPLLGVSLVALGGSWRMIFGCMVLLSAGLLIVLATRLPETLAARRLDALKPRILAQNAGAIIGHPQSRHFMGMGVLSYVIIVFVLASSPVVYAENFGVTGALFAILFALHAIGIIVGQVLNHRSISRFGSVGTALWAACWMAFILASMWGVSVAGLANAYVISGLIVLFAVGFLTVQVNSNALAMTPHGNIASGNSP
ncbi:MAG: MFS transporter [Pseudomonadota bacterium]